MEVEKLVQMANGIAAFFRPYQAEEAVAGIHNHLQAFWTPGMRAELDSAAPPSLDPLVLSALRRQPHAASPTEREAEGPDVLGVATSDAG